MLAIRCCDRFAPPGTEENFKEEFAGENADFHHLGCHIFQHQTSMSMALSILVTIELLNALNSVSEDQSMLAMPPWKNMFLIGNA